MKTLVINGSPRKNGHAMTLVNEMTKYLNGEVRIIHTYYDDISPCMDCRYCWNNIGCCINDGMQEVYKLLNEVDNIILVSPIYFSELTGQLLSFASRLQMFYVSRRIRKDKEFNIKIKKGVLVISAGGHSINLEERAIESAKIILRHLNTNLIGIARTLHTNDVSAKDDIEALIEARELALELNNLR
jgi:multimeric flavodoxin WrbA